MHSAPAWKLFEAVQVRRKDGNAVLPARSFQEYEILVDELEKSMTAAGREENGIIFAGIRQLQEEYPMPSAFEAYVPK